MESSGVKFSDITDGLSKTILVGEKHVQLHHFGEGDLDNSTYNGDHPSSCVRGTCPSCFGGTAALATSKDEPAWMFGSYHPGIAQFVFCDGSVHVLSNNISRRLLNLLATRNDGKDTPNID